MLQSWSTWAQNLPEDRTRNTDHNGVKACRSVDIGAESSVASWWSHLVILVAHLLLGKFPAGPCVCVDGPKVPKLEKWFQNLFQGSPIKRPPLVSLLLFWFLTDTSDV